MFHMKHLRAFSFELFPPEADQPMAEAFRNVKLKNPIKGFFSIDIRV